MAPWKRWLALLSVVLLVLVPQAHSALQHGVSLHLAHADAHMASPVITGYEVQVADDDSPCTLCSVLGSATQMASYQAGRPVGQTLKLASSVDRSIPPRQWSFDGFSRPPPSSPLGEITAG